MSVLPTRDWSVSSDSELSLVDRDYLFATDRRTPIQSWSEDLKKHSDCKNQDYDWMDGR